MHNFASIPIFHDTRIFFPKLNAVELTIIQECAQHETLACKIIDETVFAVLGKQNFSGPGPNWDGLNNIATTCSARGAEHDNAGD